jgi:aryl-alcohol dehydrogenase-like predicted oxidoreductase
MKVMGQGMLVSNSAGRAAAAELLQFNLSQLVASVIIGCEQLSLLEENIQAAINFTPISDGAKQRLQEKVAPSRSAWENFLRDHEDSATV